MKYADAEQTLERCGGCEKNCNECLEIGAVLDSLMYLGEINALEDAQEMEIERLTA